MIDRVQIQTEVQGGKLNRNRKQLQEAIQHFEGKQIIITLERKKSKRTLDQNAYLWGVCYPIIGDAYRELGYPISYEDVHAAVRIAVARDDKQLIFDDIVNKETGEVLTRRMRSTTEYTKSEFSDYIMYVQKYAAEKLGVVIPDPDEQLQLT